MSSRQQRKLRRLGQVPRGRADRGDVGAEDFDYAAALCDTCGVPIEGIEGASVLFPPEMSPGVARGLGLPESGGRPVVSCRRGTCAAAYERATKGGLGPLFGGYVIDGDQSA